MSTLAAATCLMLAMVGFNITLLVWLIVRFIYGFKWAMVTSSVLVGAIAWALIAISS